MGYYSAMFDLGTIHTQDLRVSEYLFSLHTPFFDWFFSLITLLGNTEIVTVITTLFVVWLLYIKKYHFAYLTLIVVIGSTTTTHLLKKVFARPRPELEIVQLETYSFPSGHATAAIALYGVMAYTVYKLPQKNHHRYALLLFLSLVVLIGFSRMYLGYHYMSDVLAGYFIGSVWLFASTYLFRDKIR